MHDDLSASGSTATGSTGGGSISRGPNQPPPRRKRRSSAMKRLAESVNANAMAAGGGGSGGSASTSGSRGSSSAAGIGGAVNKGILRGEGTGHTSIPRRSSSGEVASQSDTYTGGGDTASVSSDSRRGNHSINFASMIAGYNPNEDDKSAGGGMSVRTDGSSSMLPGHWPRQGDMTEGLEDVELATRGEETTDSFRSRGSRSTMSGFGLGTGSRFDKATTGRNTRIPTELGRGGDGAYDSHDRDNSDSESELGDERSVATLSSVNTLLNMMQMALDEDWWKDRAQAWEQSRAEPVKPALQTEEDKAAMRKKNRGCGGGGLCGWYTNMPKKYRVVWTMLLLFTLIATVVLTTTDWGERMMQDMAESMNKLKNGSVEGKGRGAGIYADEGEN